MEGALIASKHIEKMAARLEGPELVSLANYSLTLLMPLLGLVLEDEQVIVSTNRGEPLTLNGSQSPAAQAYSNIARRVCGEEVPLIDPAKVRRGLRAKLVFLVAVGASDPERLSTLKDLIVQCVRPALAIYGLTERDVIVLTPEQARAHERFPFLN